MLTCTIDRKKAIPVRALPFVTEGTFDAEGFTRLFYDPETHADPEFSRPPLYSRVSAYESASILPPTKGKHVWAKLHGYRCSASSRSQRCRMLRSNVLRRDGARVRADGVARALC